MTPQNSPLGRAAQAVIETAPNLAEACLAVWRWQNGHNHLGSRGPYPKTVSPYHGAMRCRGLIHLSTNQAGAVRRISLTQVGNEVALRMQKRGAK